MSNIPADLRYAKSHEWLRAESDGTVTIGITDYAQNSLGDITYGRAPAWLKTHWAYHKRQLNQIVSEDDKIPMVSSPERWACDYCRSWCVKVTENVASDHYKGVTFLASSLSIDTLRSTALPSAPDKSTPPITSGEFDI